MEKEQLISLLIFIFLINMMLKFFQNKLLTIILSILVNVFQKN